MNASLLLITVSIIGFYPLIYRYFRSGILICGINFYESGIKAAGRGFWKIKGVKSYSRLFRGLNLSANGSGRLSGIPAFLQLPEAIFQLDHFPLHFQQPFI